MLPTLGATPNYEGLQRMGRHVARWDSQNQPSLHSDSHTPALSPSEGLTLQLGLQSAAIGEQQREEKE